MTVLLMTGFPGFLGSALLPRVLARRRRLRAVCLVQPQHLATARARRRAIEEAHPATRGRIDLLAGDLTAPGLGIGSESALLDEVGEVWHLAAVYDLAVAADVARRVNVDGTARVLELCASSPKSQRLQYVSTCYVSGDYRGEFAEDALDVGQRFRNHYEETKFEAEMLVRKAMADGVAATVYRPGIVVGDSRTGETQKYDGPYFFVSFLRRQLRIAFLPKVADPDEVRTFLVPRDFVIDAMDRLSSMSASVGRTYALADPNAPTIREVVDVFAERLGKRVVWVPLPLGVTKAAVSLVPGAERLLGLPAELLDYLAAPTSYSTTHTTSDLAGTGVECPPFRSYGATLLDFMTTHPEIDAKAMV